MIPNLDFIKTILNGIINRVENEVKAVDEKIAVPDYLAAEGEAGHIKNKPVIVGGPGTGEGSVVFGKNAPEAASGDYAFAHGGNVKASGYCSHAEGQDTVASGQYAHAEGAGTKATNAASHAEGSGTVASGVQSHAEGTGTTAKGLHTHVEGYYTTAGGTASHAEGNGTIAESSYQHVQGKYNIIDKNDKYAHIVGNGTSDAARSNAHTVDWNGNAWYSGTVEGTAMIVKSPGGKRFKITADDSGVLTATEIT